MTTTIAVLIAAAIVTGLANWRSRRPYVPGRPPLMPYGAIQFIGILVILLMAAHLITLMTGKPFAGRFGV